MRDGASSVRRAAGMSAVRSGRRTKSGTSPTSSAKTSGEQAMKPMAPAVLGMSDSMRSSLKGSAASQLKAKSSQKKGKMMMRRGGGVRHQKF